MMFFNFNNEWSLEEKKKELTIAVLLNKEES